MTLGSTDVRSLLKAILQTLGGSFLPPPGGAGAGTTTATGFVSHFVALAAGSTTSIPTTAESYSVVLLTGTGTISGVAMPPTIPISGRKVKTAIPVVMAAASTGFLAYETLA
jgi:hypothetical protein